MSTNDNKKKNTINYIVLAIIFVMVYFGFVMFPFAILGVGSGALEKSYFISQIVSSIFVVAAFCIACFQYIKYKEEYEEERNRRSILEAANLADVYCDQIINLSSEMSLLYGNSEKCKQYLDKINEEEIELFNRVELYELFDEEIMKQWVISLIITYANMKNISLENKDSENKVSQKVSEIIVSLANKLESISIRLNTGIADKLTVYQSLHGNFFESVSMIYIYISYQNENESDRKYSNVTKLYNDWKNKFKEISIEEEIEKKEFEKSIKKQTLEKNKDIMDKYVVQQNGLKKK